MNCKLKELIEKIDDIEKNFTKNKGTFLNGIEIIYNNDIFKKWKDELNAELSKCTHDKPIIMESIKAVKGILEKKVGWYS